MKILILDEHSFSCKDDKESHWLNPRQVCEMNPQNILIWSGVEFVFITYHQCLFREHYNLAEQVLNYAQKKHLGMGYYNIVEKLREPHKVIEELKLNSLHIFEKTPVIHYSYNDASHREIILFSHKNLFSHIVDYHKIQEEYSEALAHIEKYQHLKYMEPLLNKLYGHNTAVCHSDATIVKTTEKLIDLINKEF